MKFASPGLLIVDEEHRFGVMDKEKITAMRANLDVLSLSATPIPRSLNFALSGMKSLSIIEKPPKKKKPVKTLIAPFSERAIADSVRTERARE